ncbi:MAG TPA: formyltransferase family protein [Rhodocyclaceae bacterium]|nr:formyltransferase family protein [Rhodocyclaceae bacterium]
MPHAVRTVLFLGYDRTETALIAALEARGVVVTHCATKVTDLSGHDLIVSFGYRHIIKHESICQAGALIVNLHVAYLPYNRGAHPNFWAFMDGTPHGVTIHLIDEGVDTGPILFQRQIEFSPEEKTFVATHRRLIHEIEALFVRHLDDILLRPLKAFPQIGTGSSHKQADLPSDFPGWDVEIIEYLHTRRGSTPTAR